jgi:hypothetical protein
MIRNITIIALALSATTALAGPGDYRERRVGDGYGRDSRVHDEVVEVEDFGGAYYEDDGGYEYDAIPPGQDGALCAILGLSRSYFKEIGDCVYSVTVACTDLGDGTSEWKQESSELEFGADDCPDTIEAALDIELAY